MISVRGDFPAVRRSSYSEVRATWRLTGACTTWVPTPRLRTSIPLSTSSWMPWRTVGRDRPSRLDRASSFSSRLPGGRMPERTDSSIPPASCRYSGVALARSTVRSSVVAAFPSPCASAMASSFVVLDASASGYGGWYRDPAGSAEPRSARTLLQGHRDRPLGREGLLGGLAYGSGDVAVPGRGRAGGDVGAAGHRGDPGLDLGVVGVDEPGPEVGRHRAAPAAAGQLGGHAPDVQTDGGAARLSDELGAHLVAGRGVDVQLVGDHGPGGGPQQQQHGVAETLGGVLGAASGDG